MVTKPRVEVDFNEYDRVTGEVPIARAAVEKLEQGGTMVRDGLLLQLYSPDLDDNDEPADLVVEARARFDADSRLWMACVDRATFRHVAVGQGMEPVNRR
jgi:hypothetical protein